MKSTINKVLCMLVFVLIGACKKKGTLDPQSACNYFSIVSAYVSGPVATLMVQGGTPPYSYQLNGGAYTAVAHSTVGIIVPSLIYGSNTITLTDASGGKCTCSARVYSTTIYDSRDGQYYPTDSISPYRWMTKNLNYNVPGSIPSFSPSDSSAKYGRLYTYAQALIGCPVGWVLPSDTVWKTLEASLKMSDSLVNLSSINYSYSNRGKTDSLIIGYPFNALFAGMVNGGTFYPNYAVFRTSTYGTSESSAWVRGIEKDSQSLARIIGYDTASSFSVRCVKIN
ncbi:MAG TPA: FISUMP domain-containing protein [Cytophagaceae bacterium]|nr:FISUMP domain-containing protein [Cytophagaceae bacterium]